MTDEERAAPTTRWVFGKDLKAGERVVTWHVGTDYGYRDIVAIDTLHVVPAKVLVPSVAEQHPEGLPARTMYWIDPTSRRRIACTLFDNDWLEVVDDSAN